MILYLQYISLYHYILVRHSSIFHFFKEAIVLRDVAIYLALDLLSRGVRFIAKGILFIYHFRGGSCLAIAKIMLCFLLDLLMNHLLV